MTLPAIPAPEITGDAITISYSTDGGTTWVAFAGIVDASGFKITPAKIKTGVLGAAWQRKQPGKPDPGSYGVTIVYDKAVTTTIMGWIAAKTSLYFKISVTENGTADISTAIFIGFVGDFDPLGEIKEDTRLESKITFEISDVITWTAGTG